MKGDRVGWRLRLTVSLLGVEKGEMLGPCGIVKSTILSVISCYGGVNAASSGFVRRLRRVGAVRVLCRFPLFLLPAYAICENDDLPRPKRCMVKSSTRKPRVILVPHGIVVEWSTTVLILVSS